jgi:hypothetical protein
MSVAMALLFSVWPVADWWRGFGVGVFVMAMVCADLWYTVAESQGAFWRLQGADAEASTAAIFTSHRRKRAGWEIRHGLLVNDHEIDHVAVGPGGLLAIETKWIGAITTCELGPDGLVGHQGRDPISQARTSADKVRSLMRGATGGPSIAIDVNAVLVLWGPGAPSLDEPAIRREVTILRGNQRAHWRTLLDQTMLNPQTLSLVAAKIDAIARRQQATQHPRRQHE